jgi:hypothetical protein
MNIYEAKSIFFMLEKAGKGGCGLIPLAKETKIKPSRLRRYLSHYSEFFTRAENDVKYRLNTSNHYHGSTGDMLKALKKESDANHVNLPFDLYNLFPILTLAIILLAVLDIYR